MVGVPGKFFAVLSGVDGFVTVCGSVAKEMDRKYFVEPFSKFDSAYLESLPDEVFFAKRFVMSEEDQALLLKNSSMVHGRRFYRAKVRNALMEKYAAMTNPRTGKTEAFQRVWIKKKQTQTE